MLESAKHFILILHILLFFDVNAKLSQAISNLIARHVSHKHLTGDGIILNNQLHTNVNNTI